ncbi:MAG: TIGR03905 family TSCPD domain-containing protein [Lachnospiraceae bacterium]|nr:TIGR03905 family TSCPD domain-containing protein [Lachnospiraceae bacterium]
MNTYKTRGVCSREIRFEIENNKIKAVEFVGGCAGNTQGVARLIEGMDVDEAIQRIDGIDCAGRGTSCPDQLAKALKQYQETH